MIKNSLPPTARHIPTKPEWTKLIHDKQSALAFVPEGNGVGKLVLQVDGFEQPGVLIETPENNPEGFAQQLYYATGQAMLPSIAKAIAEDFYAVPAGDLRAYVRGNEKIYNGLAESLCWIDYVRNEALMRLADKL